MARRNEGALDLLSKSPWWVSVSLSICSYVGLRHVLAQTASRDWVVNSLFHCLRKRRLLAGQRGLQTIRSLSWPQFEELVGEAYRRLGYAVKDGSGPGPDGGVDLTLRKDGELVLVQCKQWRNMNVGVKTVRELYGVMTANQASSGTVITSGSFTHEARLFAISKPIDLVDGRRLAALVGGIRTKSVQAGSLEEIKTCPECGALMVERVAKRGRRAGQAFWGCSAFPDCRAIVPMPRLG